MRLVRIIRVCLIPLGLLVGQSGCLNKATVVQWDAKIYTPVQILKTEDVATLSNKRYDAGKIGQYGYNLRRVDGVSVKTLVARDQLVQLNAGKHMVEVECFGRFGGGRRQVEFLAIAKEKYEVDGKIDEKKIEMWVQTIGSRKVVSDVAVLLLAQPLWPIYWGK